MKKIYCDTPVFHKGALLKAESLNLLRDVLQKPLWDMLRKGSSGIVSGLSVHSGEEERGVVVAPGVFRIGAHIGWLHDALVLPSPEIRGVYDLGLSFEQEADDSHAPEALWRIEDDDEQKACVPLRRSTFSLQWTPDPAAVNFERAITLCRIHSTGLSLKNSWIHEREKPRSVKAALLADPADTVLLHYAHHASSGTYPTLCPDMQRFLATLPEFSERRLELLLWFQTGSFPLCDAARTTDWGEALRWICSLPDEQPERRAVEEPAPRRSETPGIRNIAG